MIIPGRLRWLWLTLLVVLFDRATKAWIESRPLSYFPHIVIPNWISIILSKNPGIAFSFFSNGSSMFTRVVLIVGSTLIICLIAWLLVAGR
jgi:signal peptidase II